jgi:dTDP-4-amino-4,6-dideoxygalactose transaminase
MTTGGEGGMLLTDDEAIWRRAWEYKDHGKSWEAVNHRKHPPGFRWLHESFGTNWRMTEMQAAIGRRQLLKLPVWLAQRRANALHLAEGLSSVQGLKILLPPPEMEHAWYKFYVMLDLDRLRNDWDQPAVIDAINSEGIPCMAGSCAEIYREKAFIDRGFSLENPMPSAELISKSSLVFLVHPTLGEREMRDTIGAIRKVMRVATGYLF